MLSAVSRDTTYSTVRSASMIIYSYSYNKSHTRVDTDNCICDAVTKYINKTRGTSPKKLFVKRTSLGKPFVEGEKNLHISVTHAASLMLVAVDDVEIGIDCEESSRRVRDREALASRFFTPRERALLEKCDGDSKDEVFLKIWVTKEALVKLSGEGMAAITRTDSCNLPSYIEKKEITDYPGYTVVAVRKANKE